MSRRSRQTPQGKHPGRKLATLGWMLLLLLFATRAAAAPLVVVSIKPLQHIAAAITDGVSEPVLAVSENQDPHHLSLKPSERQSLQEAAVFLWVGPALELPLERLVPQLPGKVLGAQALAGVNLIHGETPDEDHGAVDAHLWLDTRNAVTIASALAAALAALDAEHAPHYGANLAAFKSLLQATETQLARRLAPLKVQAWAVEHHAFRYFEQQFGLTPALQLRGSDNNAAGVRTARNFSGAMTTAGLHCMVAEPQVAPAQLRNLLGDAQLRVASADILGTNLAPAADSYARLMTTLAEVISSCASGSPEAGLSHE